MGSRARRARTAAQTARSLALGVIRRVLEGGAYSNLALASALEESSLSDRDRRLAADLAYGVLRRKLTLDAEIERAATRSTDSIDPPAAALVRLGTYQIRFTRIPDHAAVSETVALAGPRHRSFVNAVLRRIAVEEPLRVTGDDDIAVSIRTGLAVWAVAELRRVLPEKEVETAAAALASPADLSLRTNTCRVSADRLERTLREAGHVVRRAAHHPDVIHVAAAVPSKLPGFGRGWFAVQDEASALVGSAAGVSVGDRVLDACAGPGGKATHFACLAGPDGTVVAADRSARRAALVEQAGRRLGFRLRVVVQDSARPGLEGGYDAVIVDAPCSGIGAARRRPELLWRSDPEQLQEVSALQRAIMRGVADMVRPGGSLLYAVCTFPDEETEGAARAFLSGRRDFEPAPVQGPDGPAPAHRTWPHRHGTDAMFWAGFRRRAEVGS